MTEPIRVLIVDDHPLIRRGLRTVISTEPTMELVGEACDGVEAIQLAGELASTEILRFLNRASDLVFSMARYADVDFPDLFEGRRGSGDAEE